MNNELRNAKYQIRYTQYELLYAIRYTLYAIRNTLYATRYTLYFYAKQSQFVEPEMNVNFFLTKYYENVPLRRRRENKPNLCHRYQTQFLTGQGGFKINA